MKEEILFKEGDSVVCHSSEAKFTLSKVYKIEHVNNYYIGLYNDNNVLCWYDCIQFNKIFKLNNTTEVIEKDTNNTENIRAYNVGNSNYSKHKIQPWDIWLEYDLNPWDADIVKRILRTKDEGLQSLLESRKMDYEKIIHICKERIRQINLKIKDGNTTD